MNRTIRPTSKYRLARWIKIMLACTSLMLVLVVAGWSGIRMLAANQDVTRLSKPFPVPTVLFDEDGEEAVTISLHEIEPVAYEQIPKSMIDAIVAIEDRRFYVHRGTDTLGIGRALLRNVTSGKTVQGGSTITQQLAKNVFLSHERTWKRKWQEVLLAKKIEDEYSKDDIMTLYLNQIYFGEGAWGIKRAANVYYGKPADQLTVAESALLAGLVKAPSVLSPYKRPEQAVERRNVVLSLMKEQGLLGEEEYEEAIREPLMLRETTLNRADSIQYPYYTDQVIREAVGTYGLTENDVLHGGLRIYTTLDASLQQAAERIFEEDGNFPDSMGGETVQAGAVLIDPRSGAIKALVGGRGEQPFRGLNRAVQLNRQPGSTMKPIAVYAPALENGFRPDSRIADEPIRFGDYEPKNADRAYHGDVSLYEALIQSYNIPAVKLLDAIGIEQGMEAAARFGIPLKAEDRTLGLALGGTHTGVSPLRMAEAYGTFANDGIRMPSHVIDRIESADGTVIAERKQEEGIRVTDSDTARTMNAMLMGVVERGTGKAAAIDGRELAGKTGTTEMPGTGGTGATDNWFVGYTPSLAGAVWLGYDNPDADHYLTTSSKAAAVVFKELMGAALQGQPVERFPAALGMKDALAAHKAQGKEDKRDQRKDEKKRKDKEKEQRKEQKRAKKDEDKKSRGKKKERDDDEAEED